MFPPFLLALATLVATSALSPTQANEKPELFAVQQKVGDTEALLSPNGFLLATSEGQLSIRTIYDVRTRKVLWQTASDDFFFSPDGLTAIAVEDESNAYPRWPSESRPLFHVLDVRTGKKLRSFSDKAVRVPAKPLAGDGAPPPDESEDEILDIGFNSQGSEFLVATRHFLRRFNPQKGQLISAQKWRMNPRQITRLSSAITTPDGKSALGVVAGKVHVFSVRNAQKIRTVDTPATHIISTTRNASILVTQTPGTDDVVFVQSSNGRKLWSIPDFTTNYNGLSPDGRYVLATSKIGLDIHDSQTGRKLKTIVGLTNRNIAPSPDVKSVYEVRDGKVYCWQMPNLLLRK